MANYYVRTAGGNANSLATWSTDATLKATGAAATVLPGAADDIFIETNSGNLTVNLSVSWKSVTVAEGYVGTFARSGNSITLAGSLRLASTMGFSGSGSLTLTATGALRSAGKSLGPVIVNTTVTTDVVTLEGALTATSISHAGGALNTDSFTLSLSNYLSTGTAARTWQYGTSTFNLSGTGTVWNVTGSGITGDAAGCTVNLTGTGVTMATLAIRIGTVNANAGGLVTISPNALECTNFTRNVDIAGAALALGNSLRVSGSLVLRGSATNYLRVFSTVGGTQRGIEAYSAATALDVNNAFFEDIRWDGGVAADEWAANSSVGPLLIGDAGGNNWQGAQLLTAPLTPTPSTPWWARGTNLALPSSWSLTDGGAAPASPRMPLPQDDVTIGPHPNIDGTSADLTWSGGVTSRCRNLTITHPTRKVFLGSSGTAYIHGNLTISAEAAGMYATGTHAFGLRNRAAATVSVPADKVWHPNVQVMNHGGGLTLLDGTHIEAPVSMSGANTSLTFGANVWVARFAAEGADAGKVVNLQGAHLRLTGSGTVFARTSGSSVTVNVNTSTVIEVTDTSMATKTLTVNAGNAQMNGAVFKHTVDAPGSIISTTYLPGLVLHGPNKVLNFTGNAQIGNSGTPVFDVQGTPGNPVTIQSSVAGTQRTLTYGGTGLVAPKVRYASISDVAPDEATVAYDSTLGAGNGANLTAAAGPPPWTSPTPDYSVRPYYAVVQEDSPAWYIGANDINYAQVNERGPNDRATTYVGGLVYAAPLIKEGKALVQDGDDMVTVPALTTDSSTDAQTSEFWVQTTMATTGTSTNMVRRSTAANFYGSRLGSVAGVAGETPGAVTAFRYRTDGSIDYLLGTKVVNDGLPHHVVVTWDAGVSRLYVDGVLDVTGAYATPNLTANTTQGHTIGGTGTTPQFVGTLDEIAFYRAALTFDQIVEHYNVGRVAALTGGRPKASIADTWTPKPAKVHIGGAWAEKPMKRHNGTGWVPIS